mgnify:CR=1 FL=1
MQLLHSAVRIAEKYSLQVIIFLENIEGKEGSFMSWGDKVIEPMNEDAKMTAMEAELFAEIDKRMTKSLSWATRMIGNKSVSPGTHTLLALRIYDELKVLDEQLKKDRATPRTPQVANAERPSPCFGDEGD